MAQEVKFANKKDSETIHKIVERLRDVEGIPEDFDYFSVEMDISATHANGCPLKLDELLEADNFNFMHDIVGIRNHINRKTGKLKGYFHPRFAKP